MDFITIGLRKRFFILKISANYIHTPITFGYDKQLNEELKQELKNYPDRKWANTISSMNSYCNKMEANIVSTEKNKNSANSKYSDYLDIFGTYKNLLAGFVSITFENLNFANREYQYYNDEFVKNGSKENDWRKIAANSLKDWITQNTTETISEIKPDNEFVDEHASDDDPDEINSLKNVISQLASSKSFLEEFIPSPSSPKGFKDVAGMEKLKKDLTNGIVLYINNPSQAQLDYEEYGKTIPKALLLYGPPGCGKTYITQALASEINSPLYYLNISKTGSHYINMTSKNIKTAFDEAIKISEKSQKPLLVFMDEFDSLGFERNSRMEQEDLKQVATMLQSMDSARNSNVVIIAATNKYNLIDPAIRRRFDSKIFVDVPDENSRIAILKYSLSPMKKAQTLLSSPDDLKEISKMLNGFSNNSICNITKNAALNALERNRANIALCDFKKAIDETTEEKPNTKDFMPNAKIKNKIGF